MVAVHVWHLHLPSSLQQVCPHMNLKDATIHSTQAHIEMLIMEKWVTFHLDHPDNKDVNQTAGMRQFCSRSARGLAHSTSIFFTSAQLPMRTIEEKLQHWAHRN